MSQAEYERAHREYLKQVQLSRDGQEPGGRRYLHVYQTAGRQAFLQFHRIDVERWERACDRKSEREVSDPANVITVNSRKKFRSIRDTSVDIVPLRSLIRDYVITIRIHASLTIKTYERIDIRQLI